MVLLLRGKRSTNLDEQRLVNNSCVDGYSECFHYLCFIQLLPSIMKWINNAVTVVCKRLVWQNVIVFWFGFMAYQPL